MRKPSVIVALCCLALSVLLSGCYETVNEKQAREKLEQRVKAIENEMDRPRK
jgi:outer membrane lipoprotein-sorting protein